jgi:hypothetical protein
VLVPVDGWWCPVELKAWPGGQSEALVSFSARPAQRRLARRAALQRLPWAFLAILGDGTLISLPGGGFPCDKSTVVDVWRVEGVPQWRSLLGSDRFWEGHRDAVVRTVDLERRGGTRR